MLVLVLCHFRAPVVNDLVVKLRLNFKKWWATAPNSKAAIPGVVWRCFSVIDIVRKQRLGSRSYKQKTAQPLRAIRTFVRSLLLPSCFFADPKNTYSKGRRATAVLDCQAAFSGLTLAKYCSIAALTRSGTEQFFSSAKDCSCSLISGYTTAFT